MMLANICWQCGDIGLSEALVYCLKCKIVRRHSYCLEVIPEDLSGEINWLCEDCRVQVRNSASKAGFPHALSSDIQSHGYGKTKIGLMDPCQDIVSVTDFLISHQYQHPTATVRTDSGFNNDSSHFKRKTSSCNTDTSGPRISSACLGMIEDEIAGHVKEKPKRRKWSSPDEDELDSFQPQDKVEGTSKSRFPKTVSLRTDDHGSGRTKMGLKDSYPESCPVNDNLPNPQDQHPAASVRISSSLNTESYVSNDLLRETSRCNTGSFGAVGSSTCMGLKDDDLAENANETLKRKKLCLPNQDESENLHPLVERQDASSLMGHVRHKAGQTGILNSQIKIPCQVKSLPMPSHFWSGCFIISNKRFGPFKAHLSVMACKKVCDVASQLPLDLHMQKLLRLDAWPNSFKISPPMENNIALFVFPLCDRVETVHDELVDDIINNDLMLRFQFDEVELLIFSSIVLPREHQRISGKYYPWGVFKRRIVQECSAPEGSQVNANGVEKGVQVANPNRLEKGIQVGGDFEEPANSWDKGIEDDDYGNGEALGPSKENKVEDLDNTLLEDVTRVANVLTLQGSLIPPGKERGRATSNCSKESKWSVISVADCLAACDEEKLQADLDIGGLSENCTLGPKEVAEEREVRVHTVISSKRLKVFRELEEGEIWEYDDEYAADLQSGVCQSELNQPDKVWQPYEEKHQMVDLGISSEGQKASSELEIGEICNDEFSDDVSKQHTEDVLSFQDVIHPLKVSLDDLYNGTSKKLSLSRNVLCSKCKGKGSKSGASMKCSGCQGSGMKVPICQLGPGLIQQMQHPCNECKGTGETINDKDRCPQCKGEKVVQEKKVLDVIVEKGMQNGQKITFPGEADEVPDRVTGDIVFVLQQKEHSKFKRKGEDLFVEHILSLTEALCGFQFVLTHLDGRLLLIKSNPGEVVKPDQFKVMNDEGMPIYQRTFLRGKLYIHFTVDFPDSLTPGQCKAIKAILPPRLTSLPTDMELDDREETTMHDVNIQEEMRKQKAQAQEATRVVVLRECLVLSNKGAALP